MNKPKPRSITIKTHHQIEIDCHKLVVFGDSMTAGRETLDYKHPMYHLKKTCDVATWNKLITSDDKYVSAMAAIKAEEIKYSWPNRLAKLLNIPIINHAKEGNALEKICFDLVLGKVPIDPHDLVLIGLPPPGRYIHFRLDNQSVINAGHIEEMWNKNGPLDMKTMMNFYTDDKYTWDYINQLIMLHYFKTTTHKNLYCVPQWGLPTDWFRQVKLSKNLKTHFVDTMEKIFKSDLFLTTEWHLTDSDYPVVRCEHGHPDKGTQLRMAKKLNQYIF